MNESIGAYNTVTTAQDVVRAFNNRLAQELTANVYRADCLDPIERACYNAALKILTTVFTTAVALDAELG